MVVNGIQRVSGWWPSSSNSVLCVWSWSTSQRMLTRRFLVINNGKLKLVYLKKFMLMYLKRSFEQVDWEYRYSFLWLSGSTLPPRSFEAEWLWRSHASPLPATLSLGKLRMWCLQPFPIEGAWGGCREPSQWSWAEWAQQAQLPTGRGCLNVLIRTESQTQQEPSWQRPALEHIVQNVLFPGNCISILFLSYNYPASPSFCFSTQTSKHICWFISGF